MIVENSAFQSNLQPDSGMTWHFDKEILVLSILFSKIL